MSGHEALIVAGLHRRIADFRLRLDFTVRPGECLALRGPSGCGKTSALRMILGLDRAEGGEIRLGDRVLTRLPVADRGLGWVMQDPALFEDLPVWENVAAPLRWRGVARGEARRRAREALARLGLLERADADPETLSGGERGRVSLLRTLMSEPRALLLDEPFSALDPERRERIRDDLLSEWKRQPIPVVIVTHDPDDVRALGARTLDVRISGAERVFGVDPA